MSDRSAAQAWLRALELTARIPKHPHRILSTVIEELAEKFGEAPALLSDRECLTYRALAERSNRYARWALEQGLAKGDAVCLFMPNRPEYMAIWLGITRVGGIVSLLNTNLAGPSLAHCINTVGPTHVIAAAELVDPLTTALSDLAGAPSIWAHGAGRHEFPRIDRDVERHAGEALREAERRPLTIEDRALYIYTSGTTGLPKAANVSHARLMQWSHWFAGMMDIQSSDRMYNCLPMYHSVGGVLATGAVLVGGGSVVIREKFSARQAWNDVIRWDCTLFQYIGELCRYLLHSERQPHETEHRIRMCCGNGLRPDVWDEFKRRFRIPQILEFYAATEGNVSMFNIEGKPGAIGRIPPFLAHRFPAALVKFDVERGEPVRTEQGLCIRCGPTEIGEAIGKILNNPSSVGSRFEGYTSPEASERKILRNVFEPGDAWFRTGDLMRKDEHGYFYFVDRIGDTFRWKGENVATSEVSEAICAFPGVTAANVYGVAIPGTDGRAGMAALVTDGELDLAALRIHLIDRLPGYARPLFLRIRSEMEVTTTFKHTKDAFVRQGYDPTATTDVIYADDRERDSFVRLDKALYDRIQSGQIRF
ncbi:MAG: long-chain-acyl-CoA synthetase [Candidatus Rokuibacteriota bacterium]|nr:MAG: long-chain-acyl-CoA synthetase [Candidatus Rokubacteria bacterium]